MLAECHALSSETPVSFLVRMTILFSACAPLSSKIRALVVGVDLRTQHLLAHVVLNLLNPVLLHNLDRHALEVNG